MTLLYNTNGNIGVPYKNTGQITDFVYKYSNAQNTPDFVLNEEFGTINTSVWSFKYGAYRDWQYLPNDYSNNAYSENNELVIRNLKDNPTQDYQWSGAYMDSDGKLSFLYGTVVSRIKFPSDANHYHATLWMLSENGEIDIAESDSGNVTASIHYYHDGEATHKQIGKYPVDATQYHIYRLDWTEEKIKLSVDEKVLGTFNVEEATKNGDNPFRKNMYLIINTNPLTVDGDIYSTSESVTNYVDYVKVYGSE